MYTGLGQRPMTYVYIIYIIYKYTVFVRYLGINSKLPRYQLHTAISAKTSFWLDLATMPVGAPTYT